MHLVYVDDSKDNKLACFSALLIPEDAWNECLNRLIAIRRTMKDVDAVPLRMEFHTTEWVAGKGSKVRHLDKPDRVRLYNYFLAGIAMLPGIQLINAAVPAGQDVRAFEWMLNRINRNMRDAGSNAITFRTKVRVMTNSSEECADSILSQVESEFGRPA